MLKYWDSGLQHTNYQDTVQPITLLFASFLYFPLSPAQRVPCPDVWSLGYLWWRTWLRSSLRGKPSKGRVACGEAQVKVWFSPS